MFGRFKNRKTKSERRTGTGSATEEVAIVHQSVPDEVLYPDRNPAEPKDMSWLDAMPQVDKVPVAPVASGPAATTAAAPERVTKEAPVTQPVVEEPPNPVTDGRPRFPYGWLVVVEGETTGEWFPLERGTSSIGAADGCTIPLGTGRQGRVALSFDEVRHGFVLRSDAAVRVNGVERRGSIDLRDGDTIALGSQSVRLVALCSQNFHWAEDIAAQ